jgi:hypothetical protein
VRQGRKFLLNYILLPKRIFVAILTQDDGIEYVITSIGRCLLDPKTRYAHIEKLCLSLYCACAKMRHYLLFSTCVVAF